MSVLPPDLPRLRTLATYLRGELRSTPGSRSRLQVVAGAHGVRVLRAQHTDAVIEGLS
nr:hypothetical protein [Streptomyces sp. 2132.2]